MTQLTMPLEMKMRMKKGKTDVQSHTLLHNLNPMTNIAPRSHSEALWYRRCLMNWGWEFTDEVCCVCVCVCVCVGGGGEEGGECVYI